MTPRKTLLAGLLAGISIAACQVTGPVVSAGNAAQAHGERVMSSAFCGTCHTAIYAEHEQNTHGRAFTDAEVRLATGRFDHGDCIRCHTPRPIFESGIGMNPQKRYHGLEEGNTCMTCHWRQGVDYTAFHGGAECKDAFDDRVGTVEACASCHRNHGTPYQWELAPTGKAADRTCMTCHMQSVRRPVAVGEEPRMVRSHVFPGVRSVEHVNRAYSYETAIEGNEVVVRVTNKGAGHNFPTELKQRSVESVVVVRDAAGEEVGRSRLVFRDPYKRPYGLHLPVNTQIPAGETREHRVPIRARAGTVDCELHLKYYYPIEDNHPELARQLESRRLVFDGLTPSDQAVVSEPEVRVSVPDSIAVGIASPADLVDFARPPIGKVEVTIPDGDGPEVIAQLIELFQFPVPEANRRAQARLAEIGLPAVPALINALGSWDNKTFNQSMHVLAKIGRPAVPAVLAALECQPSAARPDSADWSALYVRYHARALLDHLEGVEPAVVQAPLEAALRLPNALDRRSAVEAIGALRITGAASPLRNLLVDIDPDVVVSAAKALATFGDQAALPGIRRALAATTYAETRRDLAWSLCVLGDPAGVNVLLAGLDHRDDLIRESFFEALFAVTGVHLGYDPLAPRPERQAAWAALEGWWAADGGASALRAPPRVDPATDARAFKLVEKLGEDDDLEPFQTLLELGHEAVPALVKGLKFPPGFATKRARICELLGRIGAKDAAPALGAALRDPVLSVAAWACWALATAGDAATTMALRRYQDRLLSLAAVDAIPETSGSADALLAQAGRTRLLVGDESARGDLVRLLLSSDLGARRTAIDGLSEKYGERRGYDPEADLTARRSAAERWSVVEPR